MLGDGIEISETDVTSTPDAAFFTKDGKFNMSLDPAYEKLVDSLIEKKVNQ